GAPTPRTSPRPARSRRAPTPCCRPSRSARPSAAPSSPPPTSRAAACPTCWRPSCASSAATASGSSPATTADWPPPTCPSRQAAVLRERVQPRVLLRLEPGRLLLESSQAGVGSARVEQAAEYAADPLAVAFNPAFLLDLLRSLEPDVTLRLELSGADGPAVFS